VDSVAGGTTPSIDWHDRPAAQRHESLVEADGGGGSAGRRWYTPAVPGTSQSGETTGMPSRPLTVAVVGATGVVGRTMIQVLIERQFPVGELRLMASGRAPGRIVEVGGRPCEVLEATPEAFDGVDIALFSAGGDISKVLAPQAVEHGAVVIDNSNAWRMDPNVPLVVSQVNPDDAAIHEGIIANPNCSTMQLAPVLMALRDAVGLERVIVDTYQSVSGSGGEAMAELETQIRAHVDGREKDASVYPHPIAFNAIPEIDVFLENGYSREEWKVVTENRKILHLPELRISCTAVRIPVFISHSAAVHVETRDPISPDRARALFAAVPGVVVQDDPAAHIYPLATEAAGRDEIFVGRVRRDPSIEDGRGLAFWVVSDNLRKGAATNAVEIAELLVDRGWVARASQRAGSGAATAAMISGRTAHLAAGTAPGGAV
jgi:aspartate-semialdehyde dehydrogenase